MAFERRILRYGPDPATLSESLTERAISGCWFELRREGGCGAGELRLRDGFLDRHSLPVGTWIACEYDAGDRWYLGRIETRTAQSPAGIVLTLEGMAVQLGEVYPGGFGAGRDGRDPHRYGVTDQFGDDPDHGLETADSTSRPEDVVRLLMSQYVQPATDIVVPVGAIEDADEAGEVRSLKFQGEESVRSILKDLALRAGNAAWGVDEWGHFFLRPDRTTQLAEWQEGVSLADLEETLELELVVNRLLLTGGYVYQQPVGSGGRPEVYRWRGNYVQPDSRELYGERRQRLWAPWIRTGADASAFSTAFLHRFAQPRPRYTVTIRDALVLPRPWEGCVRLLDRHGEELVVAVPERVRVQFDHRPRLELTIGGDNPRDLWPEPPHDERYPVAPAAEEGWGGGVINPPPDGDGGGNDTDNSDIATESSSDGDSSGESSLGGSSVGGSSSAESSGGDFSSVDESTLSGSEDNSEEVSESFSDDGSIPGGEESFSSLLTDDFTSGDPSEGESSLASSAVSAPDSLESSMGSGSSWDQASDSQPPNTIGESGTTEGSDGSGTDLPSWGGSETWSEWPSGWESSNWGSGTGSL